MRSVYVWMMFSYGLEIFQPLLYVFFVGDAYTNFFLLFGDLETIDERCVT